MIQLFNEIATGATLIIIAIVLLFKSGLFRRRRNYIKVDDYLFDEMKETIQENRYSYGLMNQRLKSIEKKLDIKKRR